MKRLSARRGGRTGASVTIALRLLVALCVGSAGVAQAQTVTRVTDPTPYCGDEGVWLQILGGGGPELDDDEAPASYAVFLNNKVRLLVDAAPGAAYLFDRAGARIRDLDAIVLTNVTAARTSDLPALVVGGQLAERDRLLPILGPDGRGPHPDTETLIGRLMGPDGAYPTLAVHLEGRGVGGFRLSPRNVPATGTRRWAGFGNEDLQLAALPVQHGDVPALAWRAELDGMSLVFAGDFGSATTQFVEFAKGADALVIHHSVPDGVRGDLADRHLAPGQIGRIAEQAGVRMVILGHRMNRTRGRESLSTAAIEEHYDGPLIFANDLECWGL